MKIFFTKLEIYNMLKETGDDVMHLKIFFKTSEHDESVFPFFLTSNNLVRFLEKNDVLIANYLNKIKSSIDGYGPKHSKIFEIMDQESFDLKPSILKYLENLSQTDIESHFEWSNRLVNSKPEKNINLFLEKMDNLFDENFVYQNIKSNNFKDDLDQTTHELSLKYYPELFEKDEKILKECRGLLINTTLSFSQKINKLLHSK